MGNISKNLDQAMSKKKQKKQKKVAEEEGGKHKENIHTHSSLGLWLGQILHLEGIFDKILPES